MPNFPSGDTTRFGGGVLVQGLRLLVIEGCLPIADKKDSTGLTYAKLMTDKRGSRFYLIARGADFLIVEGVEFFGTQVDLVLEAEKNDRPIVLFYRGDFYIFSPFTILEFIEQQRKRDQANVRHGVEMLNVPFNLGEPWNPSDPLMSLYRQMNLTLTQKRLDV